MEVQLFHWNTKYSDYNTAANNSDGLAAVSFFYEVSSADNPAIVGQISVLEQLIEVLEQQVGSRGQPQRHFVEWPNLEKPFPTSSLSQLLPSGGLDVSDNYFYYSGSLTLPNTTTTITTTTTTTTTTVTATTTTTTTAPAATTTTNVTATTTTTTAPATTTTTTTATTATTTVAATRAQQTSARSFVEVEDCSESVLWIVYEKKIAISEAQLSVYRKFLSITQLCSHNFRPLYPLNPSVLTSGVSQPATGRKSNY